MQENGVATDVMIPEVLTRMRQFTGMNKLKKNALKVWAGGARGRSARRSAWPAAWCLLLP